MEVSVLRAAKAADVIPNIMRPIIATLALAMCATACMLPTRAANGDTPQIVGRVGFQGIPRRDGEAFPFDESVGVEFAKEVDPKSISVTTTALTHGEPETNWDYGKEITIRLQREPSHVYAVTFAPTLKAKDGTPLLSSPLIVHVGTPPAPPPPPPSASRKHGAYPFFGALAHFPDNMDLAKAQLQSMKAIGVRAVRLDVPGNAVEKQPRDFDFGGVDRKLDMIVDAGMVPLPVLDQYAAPAWANGGSANNWQPIWREPSEFAAYAGAVAAHIAKRFPAAKRIELGQEINTPGYWAAPPKYANADGSGQAPYMIAAYRAIKSAAPSLSVWLSITSTGVNSGGIMDQLYNNGAGEKKAFDGLAVHNYTWYDPTHGAVAIPNPWLRFDAWRYYQKAVVQHGDPQPHVMITEWGYSADPKSPDAFAPPVQAYYDALGLNMMLSDPTVDAQFYTGVAVTDTDFWAGFRMLALDGSVLPAGRVYRAAANF